ADVRVHVTGAAEAGGDRTLTKRIPPGVVTDLTLAGLTDGTHTVRVTSNVPVIAGVRVSVVGDPTASTTETALPVPADGTAPTTGTGGDRGLLGDTVPGTGDTGSATTTTVDPSATTSTARGIDLAWIPAAEPLGASAAVAVADGPSPNVSLANPGNRPVTARLGSQSLTVPAGGTTSIPVEPGVIVLTGSAGLRAAVSFAGPDAVAAYPVAPADQAARPVRVTH
ncbi:MAG: hypothetical protein QOJ68_272, partial [Blastococcus sp.]|nr:hypothetical protein [Blastococcus sp.]